MTAKATQGNGVVTIKFVLERNINDVANDVREKVAGAMKSVPSETLPPVIQRADPEADPIMSLVLSSTSGIMTLRTLTEIADKQVARELQSVDGVGAVTLGGGRAREVHIVVDIEKLVSYRLTIDQVRDAIQKEYVEVPGGTVEQGKSELELRTLGRVEATHQFNNIIITTVNGTAIKVSDIGYAEDSTERPMSELFAGDGKPAVRLDIRRASGENTIKVTEGIKQKLKTIQQILPQGTTRTISVDDFLGPFDLVFVRSNGGDAVRVRVVVEARR